MQYTLGQAAKRLNMNKSTLSRHRQEGRFTAEKNSKGHYVIDESELARAYPDEYSGNTPTTSQSNATQHNATYTETADYQAEVRIWKERAQMLENERDDLRRRLDDESEERRKLTAMLTDERTQKRRGFWARLFAKQKQ